MTIAEKYSVEAYLRATGVEQFTRSFQGAARNIDSVDKNSKKASNSLGNMFKVIAGSAAVVGAFNSIRKAVDGAISRYDTLGTFPKVLEQMGFSAEESERAINKLSDGIQGLPTTLDDVAGTAQRIAILTGNLEGATDTTLALNNAFIASGSSTNDASRGLEQYVQLLSRGEVDLQSWRTLQETMGVALNDTAKAFGFAGASAQNDLYDALKNGDITFEQFNNKLIELSNSTNGFAERARTSSGGIRTAWTNMNTAIVRGVTNIISAIDSVLADSPFKSIENIITTMGQNAFNALNLIVLAIEPVGGAIMNLLTFLSPLAPVVDGIVASFTTLLIVGGSVVTWTYTMAAAQKALALALSINPIILVIGALVGLGVALYNLYQTSDTFREKVTSAFNALKNIAEPVITEVTNFIMTVWGSMVTWWKENNEKILTTIQTVWDSIMSVVNLVVSEVVDFVMSIWGKLTDFWQENGQMIMDATNNVWNVILTVITKVVNAVRSLIEAAMPVIVSIMEYVWPFILSLIKTTWDAIKNVIEGAIDVITGIVKFFAALFTGDWSALWDAVKQIVNGAVQAIWGLVDLWFVGKILKLGKALLKGLKKIVDDIWKSITSLFNSGVTASRNIVYNGFDLIKNKITTIMNAIKSFFTSIWNSIKSFIDSVINSIKNGISNNFNAIKNVITTVVNAIKNVITTVFNAIKNTITTVTNNIKSTISNIFNSLSGIVKNAFSKVKNVVSDGMRSAYNAVAGKIGDFFKAGSNIVGSIADGIKKNAKKVTDAIGNVTQKIRDFLPFSPAKEGALRDIMDIKIPQSIAESIDKGKKFAVRSMDKMTNEINKRMPEIDLTPNLSSYSYGSGKRNTNTNYGNRNGNGDITQNITIVSPDPTSPSENARKMKQAQRQLAMEWGL